MRVRIKVSVTDERDTCQDASSINDLIEFNALDRERLGVGHFLNVASVKRACAHGAALQRLPVYRSGVRLNLPLVSVLLRLLQYIPGN